jgi:hypothetical protein
MPTIPSTNMKLLDLVKNQDVQQALNSSWFSGISLAWIIWGCIFSIVGMGYLIYAKKKKQMLTGICGLILCVYPIYVRDTKMVIIIGIILCLVPIVVQKLLNKY